MSECLGKAPIRLWAASRAWCTLRRGLLPSICETGGRHAQLGEGPRWKIVISLGVIRIRIRDYAKVERTAERQRRHHMLRSRTCQSYSRRGR